MLTKKLKGGALYIALIICTVIGITLTMFIMIGHFNQRKVIQQSMQHQLQYDLQSAFNYSQSEYFPDAGNNQWKQNDFNEDSLRVKKLQWGAYVLISAEAKNRQQYIKQCGLFGVLTARDTALLIADKGRPIGLSGTIKMNGHFYFPKAGFKPVFIEGQSFNTTGNLQIYMRASPLSVPDVKPNFVSHLKKSISDNNPDTDSLIGALPQQINNPFSAKTIVYRAPRMHMDNYNLSGNIKICCNDQVIIENNNMIDNIFIIAPKITIKKGFKGSVHALATDTILVEEDCVLSYPSSLTLLNTAGKNPKLKGVFIDKNSMVSGSIICLSEKEIQNTVPKVIVKLDKECQVYGLVFSSGYAHLQGKIYGNVICESLMVKTTSSVYENHMMDCEIDPKKHVFSLVVPALFKTNGIDLCCRWL